MPEVVTISVNGQPFVVPAGTTVAAAMLRAGGTTRTSVSGEMRAPLCGMGICFECRAVIGGKPHERTCQIVCEPGMDVWST